MQLPFAAPAAHYLSRRLQQQHDLQMPPAGGRLNITWTTSALFGSEADQQGNVGSVATREQQQQVRFVLCIHVALNGLTGMAVHQP